MKHIHKINSVPYTVVLANEPLEQHISIIQNPNLFEILESEIPSDAQFLNYQSNVVEVITRRQFKIALAVLGKNEQDILNGINQLPEPTKTIALISYTEAGTFERSNPELIFVGKMFLQMTDAQIDNIFIVGSQY